MQPPDAARIARTPAVALLRRDRPGWTAHDNTGSEDPIPALHLRDNAAPRLPRDPKCLAPTAAPNPLPPAAVAPRATRHSRRPKTLRRRPPFWPLLRGMKHAW